MKAIGRLVMVILLLFLINWPSKSSTEPIPDQVRKCVAYIVKPGSVSDKNTPMGTAFFVGYKYAELPDKNYVFIVTARHLLFDENGTSMRSY